jgi:hypothetical protein
MSACQRSSVRDEAIRRSWLRCLLGMSWASADRIARSAQEGLGQGSGVFRDCPVVS